MISLLLFLVSGFLAFIIGLLPTGGVFPSEVHSAFSTLGGYVGLIDVFVPVSVLLWCLTLVFGVEIALFSFKTIKWLISHIPIIGGHGNK